MTEKAPSIFMKSVAEEALSIFISYSHHDSEMLNELITHLAGLRRTNRITTWDDRAIGAGDEWEPAIRQRLNTADIIILLISADFIASDYCYGNELPRAIERHDAGEARVIPVILEPCLWNLVDIPFSKLNVLPDRAHAITQWPNRAEAFTNVVRHISSTVESLRARRPEKSEIDQDRTYFRQKILDWYNRLRSSVVGSLINRLFDVSTTVVSPEILIDDSLTFQEGRKRCLKEEIFFYTYLASKITHEIKESIELSQEHCRQKIRNQHSRMRLLSGEDIGVDQLYVDVWLLGRPEKQFLKTTESLLLNFDIAKDRLALSRRIQRDPGFEIANRNPKLIILGKPGSGKTTFLKHLAVDWCNDQFQPAQIAVLIELRRIREQDNRQKWNLFDAISQELELEKQVILFLLELGKLLVLLDGLDEVPTDELRRNVQSQIEQVSEEYSNENRFILTCRTQIMGAIPSGFASVEVADFNSEQIEQFVRNWLIANRQPEIEVTEQWERLQLEVSRQPGLREVTATPVLLSLICVVWQDSGEIPTNRTNLYKRGISWLLRRWNDENRREGWEVGTEAYRQLSVKDKEALLTEIAARKFENPKNFVLFEQDELVEQISQKLQLANAQEGLSVLKAIEAQHGLLIERADELWSFSHLTFQEFFTVQWLTQLSPKQLVGKIANQQWQKTVEQLVKSQQPADRLLRLIKQAIDQLIAQEPLIQTFLSWLLHKSDSLQTNYKPAAIRAFYYLLTLDIDLDLDLDLAGTLDLVIDLDRDLFLDSTIDSALNLDSALLQILDNALALDRDRDLVSALDLDLASVPILVRNRVDTLNLALDRVNTLNRSPDLISCLRQLKDALPTSIRLNEIQRWWPLQSVQWREQLQNVMIEHRNIGRDWQFTQVQQQQLRRYYEANKFLVDLMNIEGAVSEGCRTDVEEGLLLPWAELQLRQPHLYGELEG